MLVLAEAPALLVGLEQSTFAAGIRQSPWAYPAANVGHIAGLFLFAGAISVMDLALLGVFRGAAAAKIVVWARRGAIAALILLLATGAILFTAEASHVAMNPVFQIKALLIALGLANALLIGPPLRRALAETPAAEPFPQRLRWAAGLSLMVWLSVAICGRLIAYF
jgi:hypothetical protein